MSDWMERADRAAAVAAEHGAIGCILYSDPDDDGYHAGDTYPKGGMRPAEGVQRGRSAGLSCAASASREREGLCRAAAGGMAWPFRPGSR